MTHTFLCYLVFILNCILSTKIKQFFADMPLQKKIEMWSQINSVTVAVHGWHSVLLLRGSNKTVLHHRVFADNGNGIREFWVGNTFSELRPVRDNNNNTVNNVRPCDSGVSSYFHADIVCLHTSYTRAVTNIELSTAKHSNWPFLFGRTNTDFRRNAVMIIVRVLKKFLSVD